MGSEVDYEAIEEANNEFDEQVAQGGRTRGLPIAHRHIVALPPPSTIPIPPSGLQPGNITSPLMREALQVF